MSAAETMIVVDDLPVPERFLKIKGYVERYAAIAEWIDEHGISVTKVALSEDLPLQTLIGEILGGMMRDDNKKPRPSEYRLSRRLTVELATVDGRPFASRDPSLGAHLPGVKVGLNPAHGRRLRTLKQRGVPGVKMRDYPAAQFTVDASEGLWLLKRYGYRCVWPEFRRRSTQAPINQWLIYEVGGPLKGEVLERYGTPKKKGGR